MTHRFFRFVPACVLFVAVQGFASLEEDAALLKSELSAHSSVVVESLIRAITPTSIKTNAKAPSYSVDDIAQMSEEDLRRIRQNHSQAKSAPSKRVRINNTTYVVSQILATAHPQHLRGTERLLNLHQIVAYLSDLKSHMQSATLLFQRSQVDYQYSTFNDYVGLNEFGVVIELNDGTVDDNNDYGGSYPGTYLFFVFHPIG